MKLQSVLCDLCGSDEYRFVVRCNIEKTDTNLAIKQMNIVKCKHCALVYVNPVPELTDTTLDVMYSKEYFDAPYMQFYVDEGDRQSNESFEQRLSLIEKFSDKGKLLDVGCASGGFLTQAKKRGWHTYGVEISETAALKAKKRHNHKIFHGELQEATFDNEFFDVVSISDVLEHVMNPSLFLKEAHRILKKDGLLYLAVPNFDGVYYKLAVFLSKFNHRNYFVLPYHIYFFSINTLCQYLKKANFKLTTLKMAKSNISRNDISGALLHILFYIAGLMGRQDRVVCLAKKT